MGRDSFKMTEPRLSTPSRRDSVGDGTSSGRRSTRILTKKQISQIEKNRYMEELEKFYPVMKFAEEPLDQPFCIVVDLTDLNEMTFAQMYSAVSHIFPKENIKDKIQSIKFQDMNIQTHSINKRERWIIKARDIITRNRIFNMLSEVLPVQNTKPIVKLYKTALSEEYKRFLKFHASKEKQTDFIFSGGLKSATDIQQMNTASTSTLISSTASLQTTDPVQAVKSQGIL